MGPVYPLTSTAVDVKHVLFDGGRGTLHMMCVWFCMLLCGMCVNYQFQLPCEMWGCQYLPCYGVVLAV